MSIIININKYREAFKEGLKLRSIIKVKNKYKLHKKSKMFKCSIDQNIRDEGGKDHSALQW